MKKLLFLILLTPFAYAEFLDIRLKLTTNDWLNQYHYALGTSRPMDGIVITNYCITSSVWQLIKTTEGEILSFAPRPSGEGDTSFRCKRLSKEKWMKSFESIIKE